MLKRFAGLGTNDRIICSVVSNSFRPLVVESGDEPEAILRHRILARRCHRSIGDNFSVRDGESSTTGVETTQTLQDWIRVCVVATVAPSGAEADLHQSCVACGFSWSMCLSHFARGRMSSSIRLFR